MGAVRTAPRPFLTVKAVSYTHLDVYKRQLEDGFIRGDDDPGTA